MKFIVHVILLLLYLVGSGYIVGELSFLTLQGWEMEWGHTAACVVLLWLIEPRWLLLALGWVAPLLLYYRDHRTGYVFIEFAVALLLFRDAAERLAALIAKRRSDADRPAGAGVVPPLPATISLCLLALILTSLAAAIQPAPEYLALADRWYEILDAPYRPIFTLMALFGPDVHAGAYRILYHVLASVALLAYVYRTCDADFARQFIVLGGIGCLGASLLGLAEYLGAVNLSDYRPRNLQIDYIFGTRRLMSTAQHSAWFGQYVVLTWPFFLLLPERTRGRRTRFAIGCGIALVVVAAVLTLQRAFWLILMALLAILAIRAWLHRRHELGKFLRSKGPKILGWGALIVVGLAAVDLMVDHRISRRLVTIFAYRDRLYYYYSTFFFLTESPGGIGLGMHGYLYESIFVPWGDFYQGDHDTAHNLWLHLAVERGPLAALAMLIFPAALLTLAWRARLHLPESERRPALCLTLSLAGIYMYGAFQYIYYIRIIELYSFIAAGMLLRLTWPRLYARDAASPKLFERLLNPPALLRGCAVALIAAAAVASAVGQRRFYADIVPEVWPVAPHDSSGWTGKRARYALPCSAERLTAVAYAFDADKSLTVTLDPPEPQKHEWQLAKDAPLPIHVELRPYDAPVWRKFRWIVFEVSQTVQEAQLNADGTNRTLGAYLTHLATENNRFASDE